MKLIPKTLALFFGLAFLMMVLSRQAMAQAGPVSGGPVTLRLEQIKVANMTNPETDPDDPYFVVIKFRSRFFTLGSTQVMVCGITANSNQDDPLCGKPWDFANLGNGAIANIPESMGGATFTNVHYSTLNSIVNGDYPEIIGVAIVAMENEHSIDTVLEKAQGKAQEVRDKLVADVEQGKAIDNFIKANDQTANQGEGDKNPETIKIAGTGCGGESLSQEVPGNDIDTDFWGPLAGGLLGWGLTGNPLGGLTALFGEGVFNALVDFGADDVVDLRVIAYITVDNSDLTKSCSDLDINNAKKAFLTVLPQGTLNECPSHLVRCQRFDINTNDPIKFNGQGGEWHVTLSVTVDAPISTGSTSPYIRRQPSLANRLFLPLIQHDSGTHQPVRAITTTVPLQTLQYNVQFLTPWNNGVIAKDHWPNTSGRAIAIGEALACYDLVALNESVNDQRRKEIIDMMRANAPYCGRPNLLLGESYFTYVSGPRIEDAQIDSLQAALNIFTSTVSYTDFLTGEKTKPLVGDEVTIISRFPIVESHSYIYQSAYGVDALAAKGILHARIQVGDATTQEFVDVFTTHLQASDKEIAVNQVAELADFIVEHTEPDIPLLVLGDFNIAGPYTNHTLIPEEQQVYDYLMATLTTLSTNHALQDIGLGLNKGTNHDKDKNVHRRNRIDYILLTPSQLKFSQSAVKVKEFDGNGWGTLSDHAGVEANLTWEKTVYVPTVGKPDLIVENLHVSPQGVEVTIKNIGNVPVLPGSNFWIEVYINPHTAPTAVNQVWQDMGDYGLVWGINSSALPLPPGAQMILELHDPYYASTYSLYPAEIAAGSQIFAQIDSANSRTGYGGVLEGHEELNEIYNNISLITLQQPVPTQQWNQVTAAETSMTESMAQSVLLTTPR